MAVGVSGRIVIEIDPELKRDLHDALADKGMTLKQWFLENTQQFLDERIQPTLPLFGKESTTERKNEI